MIQAVAGCLKDNNFRVVQGSLSVLGILVEQMGQDFQPFVGTVGRPRTRKPSSSRRCPACRTLHRPH